MDFIYVTYVVIVMLSYLCHLGISLIELVNEVGTTEKPVIVVLIQPQYLIRTDASLMIVADSPFKI